MVTGAVPCLAVKNGALVIHAIDIMGLVATKPVFRASDKVSKGAKIRNRYNQVPHLTQDTNGKVTNSQ